MHRCPLFKNYTNQCFPYQLSISLNSVVFLSLCTGIDGGVLRGLQPWGCCLASPDSGSGSWLKMDPKRFQVTRSLPLQARYCSSRLLEFAEAEQGHVGGVRLLRRVPRRTRPWQREQPPCSLHLRLVTWVPCWSSRVIMCNYSTDSCDSFEVFLFARGAVWDSSHRLSVLWLVMCLVSFPGHSSAFDQPKQGRMSSHRASFRSYWTGWITMGCMCWYLTSKYVSKESDACFAASRISAITSVDWCCPFTGHVWTWIVELVATPCTKYGLPYPGHEIQHFRPTKYVKISHILMTNVFNVCYVG